MSGVGATVTPNGGAPMRLFGVFANWVNGTPPSNVVTQSQTLADTTCP